MQRWARSLWVLAGLLAVCQVHMASGDAEVASLDSFQAVEPATGVPTKKLVEGGEEAREEAAADKAAEEAAAADEDEAPETTATGKCECMTRAELAQHDKEKGIRRVAAQIAKPPSGKKKEEPCATGSNATTADPAAAVAGSAGGDGAKGDKSEAAMNKIADDAKAKADVDGASAEKQMAAAKAAVDKAAQEKADATKLHEQAVQGHKNTADNMVAKAQAAVDKSAIAKDKAIENHASAMSALEAAKEKRNQVHNVSATSASADKGEAGSGALAVPEVAANASNVNASNVNASAVSAEGKGKDAKTVEADPIGNMDPKTAATYISEVADKKKDDKETKAGAEKKAAADATAAPALADLEEELLQEEPGTSDAVVEAKVDVAKAEDAVDAANGPKGEGEKKTQIYVKAEHAGNSANVTALATEETDEEAAECVCKPGTGAKITPVDHISGMDSKTAAAYVEITKPKVAQDAEKGKQEADAEAAAEVEAGGDGTSPN